MTISVNSGNTPNPPYSSKIQKKGPPQQGEEPKKAAGSGAGETRSSDYSEIKLGNPEQETPIGRNISGEELEGVVNEVRDFIANPGITLSSKETQNALSQIV